VSEELKTENSGPKGEGVAPEKGGSSAQQRVNPRFKVNWPARALLPDKRILGIRVRDVSVGGVGFECAESVPMGSGVNIELTPWVGGKKLVIRVKCVVTYHMLLAGNAGFSHGVRFTDVQPKQLEDLKMVLKSLAT
jgi:hypothetical protein